ncbi:flagellar biosynthesis anti-sigma factor FlgM [Suilimivivens sp.]|uniref:flagellar biosynthesis anti-sigma factor FlgM n=1 Tax=Suilimivivens sp. TaxID=2981669 RepID=UPI00307B7E08
MRIEAYSQIQQIYNTNRTTKTQEKNHVRPTDQLQISSMGRDMQIAKEAARAASDIREEVTAPLKASIEAGTYHVSTESFADKLFFEYEEMR